MAKSSVSAKMLYLSGLYLNRMERNLRAERPDVATYWATMIHGQFALARSMAADGQMHKDVFDELNKHDDRAMKIIQQIGPQELEGLGAADAEACAGAVLEAYGQFREEGERLGVL